MGWTSYYRAPGQTDLDHFRNELIGTTDPAGAANADGVRHALIAGASYRNVFYGAVQISHPDGSSYVTAVVCLMKRFPSRKPAWSNDANFCYKSMDEGAGPCETQCPQRILDLLSPIEQIYPGADLAVDGGAKWAADWRQACRDRLAARAAKPSIPDGAIVALAKPIEFGNGESIDTFAVVRRGRARRFYRAIRESVWIDGADGRSVLTGYRWSHSTGTHYRVSSYIRGVDYQVIAKHGDSVAAA
jgi:hypothetical protein